jgi:hypothetical protein
MNQSRRGDSPDAAVDVQTGWPAHQQVIHDVIDVVIVEGDAESFVFYAPQSRHQGGS